MVKQKDYGLKCAQDLGRRTSFAHNPQTTMSDDIQDRFFAHVDVNKDLYIQRLKEAVA